ncbi:MAG: glycosyltransferase family 39 protein, partial [Victivallales bacterium]|nr:glycosyltransferase family 39 protein [Victivallales bacterium]
MKNVKNFSISLFILITVSLVIKCVAAAAIGLGNDEVYYITYGLHPALSHFDHPPMLGFLIQLGTLNLTVINQFTMRIGAIIIGTGSIITIYFIGKTVRNERTGLIAAYISVASIYMSVICGAFILPDPPLLFFVLLSFYFFLKYIPGRPEKAENSDIWFSFLFLGLAIYSKYQACYLGFGVLLYIIFCNRAWFKKKIMYIGVLIPIFFVGLIYYWNYKNGFAGTSFQEARVDLFSGINLQDFFREIGGEIGYYNPVNIVLIIISLYCYRKLNFIKSVYFKLILFCSLPLIFTVWLIAISNGTLPHWVGISYMLLLIIPAAYLDSKLGSLKFPAIYAYSMLTVALIAVTVVYFGIVPWGYTPKTNDSKYAKAVNNPPPPSNWVKDLGHRDFTLDTQCWNKVNRRYKDFIKEQPEYKNYPIVGCHWFISAYIDFYVAIPNNKKFIMYGDISQIHEYYWVNKIRGELKKGDNALFIVTSHRYISPNDRFKSY